MPTRWPGPPELINAIKAGADAQVRKIGLSQPTANVEQMAKNAAHAIKVALNGAAAANSETSSEIKTIDEGVDSSFLYYQQYMKNDTGILPDESSKEEFKKQLIATLNKVKGILKDKNVDDYIYKYIEYYGKNPHKTAADIATEIRLDVYGESEPKTGGYRKRSTRKHKKSRKHRKSRTR